MGIDPPFMARPAAFAAPNPPRLGSLWGWPLAIAALLFAAELATAGRYGMTQDEFYFLACAKRLGLGYVDHPPLIAAVASACWKLSGGALIGLRIAAALTGAGTVLVCAATAGRLGGGAYARSLAALAVASSLILVAMFNVLTMNPIDIFLVSLAAYALSGLRSTPRSNTSRPWIVFGLVAGIGLQNKLTPLVFGFGVLLGLLASERRSDLRTRGPWLAAGLAALIYLPHLGWQAVRGWPTLEFMRAVEAHRNPDLSPLRYLFEVALSANPVVAPLWIAGVLYLLIRREHRMLGVATLTVLAAYANCNSQVYYVAPVLPTLFAAGAVAFERHLAPRFLRLAAPVVVGVSGLICAPLAMPLLEVDAFLAYSARVPLIERVELHHTQRLPVYFASRFGWTELTARVEELHEGLGAAERAECILLAKDYGKASALELLGEPLGLPPVYSGHNSWWFWGPPSDKGETAIAVGLSERLLKTLYASVEPAGMIEHPYAHPWQTHQPVFVCRGLLKPLSEAWPRLRRFA